MPVDNHPGGAGHVLELAENHAEWLRAAKEVAYVDEDHDKKCRSACLRCLLTFDSGLQPADADLNRKAAMEILDSLQSA